MRVPAILADDLTGALDTAAQFTGRWGPVAVHRGPPTTPQQPPCAISSETRDLPASEAVPVSLAAAQAVAGRVTFRKIDSLLRGPWAAELAALYRAGGFRRCVLAPAFPAQGRRTLRGMQMVPDRPPIDIAALLADEGLAADEAGPIHIADAATEADLDAIVAAEASLAPLWCGAAGLARAVAGTAAHRPPLGQAPTLAIVGSDHPVARAQLETVVRRRPAAIFRVSPGAVPGCGTDDRLMVLCFALPPDAPRAEAAAMIARELARLLPGLPPPARLVVTGGATLAAVLVAVGARRMLCLGEVAPGLPVSRLADGLWAGVEVLSKSGAFGGAATLLDLCTAPEYLRVGERF